MRIKSIGLARLHTASHIEFHESVYRLLNSSSLPIPALTGVLDAYLAECQVESTLVRRQRASALTPKIAAKDKERDSVMYEILYVIKANLKSNIPARYQAAAALEIGLRPYRKDAYDQMTDQTQDVDGMIGYLNSDSVAAHLLELMLNDAARRLDEANNEFRQLYAQRVQERKNSAGNSINTGDQRRTVDIIFRQACDLLEAASLMLADEERASVEERIIALNSVVEQYKLVISNQNKTRSNSEKIDKEVDEIRLQAAKAEIKQARLEERAARAAAKARKLLMKAEQREGKRKVGR